VRRTDSPFATLCGDDSAAASGTPPLKPAKVASAYCPSTGVPSASSSNEMRPVPASMADQADSSTTVVSTAPAKLGAPAASTSSTSGKGCLTV
jgi:hypothetical protein